MTPNSEATSPSAVGTARPADAEAGVPMDVTWLLRRFAVEVSGVTHAVLLSRDGLRLSDSEVDKDWADELSAAVSGVASLAANVTGPTRAKRPARQVIIERDDCFLFIQGAGRSSAFRNFPGHTRGMVDTVLAVIAYPDADVGSVGFEMGRLVEKFAPYMDIPVRQVPGDEAQ